ncbi:MAG: hypothetical protein A3K19_17305 [Lentisphaerae bacterium RIFOXYB12_FULL_65_16]|nr:MAG: hypothetical protein A3K18_09135 [Lentisphaerae bacterium RIFOXYA12_64_32]OGV85623.1 MAG: hypothetical protein A3K19_17305 [Lentisphaerae bacterium RIFOXYB12_FULL_65_16]
MIEFGTIINGYRIERELGHGSMAVVYLANQINLQRLVAFKVLSATLAQNPEFVERFLNEARSAAALSHQNLVLAYDAGVAGDTYYFVMEYVEGENLDFRIRRDGALPHGVALSMATAIAAALDYGWRKKKLTHGDIKPENIMVDKAGTPKVADFGLAKVTGHETEGRRASGILLTPAYAAPEVIRGRRVANDCRADIYSFGATLYHMLVGYPPFPGTDADVVMKQHLTDPIIPPLDRNPAVPLITSDFVCWLLEKEPERRPQSWEEVTRHLKKVRSGKRVLRAGGRPFRHDRPGGATSGTASGTARRPRASFVSRLLTLLLVLVALTAGLLFLQLKWRQMHALPPPETPAPQPETTPAPEPSTQPRAAQTEADTEWAALQPKLKAAESARERMELLEAFRRNHERNLPPEFRETMAQSLRETDKEQPEPAKPPEPEAPEETQPTPEVGPPVSQPPPNPFPPEPEGRAREKTVEKGPAQGPRKHAPK